MTCSDQLVHGSCLLRLNSKWSWRVFITEDSKTKNRESIVGGVHEVKEKSKEMKEIREKERKESKKEKKERKKRKKKKEERKKEKDKALAVLALSSRVSGAVVL